jgi:hypothetical protein
MSVLTWSREDVPLDRPRAARTIGSGIRTSDRAQETDGPDSGSP